MTYRTFALLILLSILSSCSQTPGPSSSAVEVEGFEPYPTARAFDPPGRIYRVDPSGRVFGVTVLGVTPREGREVIPKVSGSKEFSLKQMFETIGIPAEKVPLAANADLERKYEFATESVDGQREYLDDNDIDAVLSAGLDGVRIRDNNQYFLIRETILSSNLTYRSNKSWLIDLGIEAEFKEAVKGEAELDWSSETEFSLNKEFGEPLRIWYKAEQLDPEEGFGIGAGQPALLTRSANDEVVEFHVPEETVMQP